MSDKAIAFVAAEMDALAGLPLMQRWLYMVLRWYMDRKTGRVGVVRGISLQGLAEELYVEPVRGRHVSETGSPSKKAVRSALDGLVRAGLIQPCGNGEVLVFFMPKARRVSARQKDEGHMRGTGEGHGQGDASNSAEGRVVDGFSQPVDAHDGHDEGQGVNADEGHTSRVKVNHLSVETSSSTEWGGVDKKLSTVSHLVLMSDVSIAGWIKDREKARGKLARVHPCDVRKAGWVEKCLCFEDIAEAYETAVAARKARQSPAPVNVQYMDSILMSMLAGRKSAVSEGGRTASGGIGAVEQAEQAARRFGVPGQLAGESAGNFISRINDEAEARRLGVAGRGHGESAVEFMARLAEVRKARRKAVQRG